MRKGRSTITLLAIVTAALCAGTIAWVVAPVAGAESASEQQDGLSPNMQSRAVTPGPATLPLRWHVDYAIEATGGFNTFCTTSVVTRNVTSASITTQVEWFDWVTGSLGYLEQTVPAGSMRVIAADGEVLMWPVAGGLVSGLADFFGYANVNADDPRVHVSAYVICRDNTGVSANLVALTPVGTSPVGATAQYFQAGMPASWTPPMAVPEVPE